MTYRGAGSNGTAIGLTFTLYSIIANPHVWERLRRDIRSTFKRVEDITNQATEHLPFLDAVIKESSSAFRDILMLGLRLYPAAAVVQPRVTPPEGMMIAGWFIGGNVCLGSININICRLSSAARTGRSCMTRDIFRTPIVSSPRDGSKLNVGRRHVSTGLGFLFCTASGTVLENRKLIAVLADV